MRLDVYLMEKGLASTRTKAQTLIKNGLVSVNDKIIYKPSYELFGNENITITEHHNYVSRGSFKLLGAIEKFDITFKERVVVDIGASTGGFSQVALESGAKKVYAIDVGSGELDKSLLTNPKLINLENTDFRNIKQAQVADADMVIGDISFISLVHIFPKIKELFDKIEIVMLFKPQFECGKEIASKFKGIIKDKKVHIKLLENFIRYIEGLFYVVSNVTYSPIKGKSGNIEYLFHINGKNKELFSIPNIVEEAFCKLKK